MPNKIDWSKVKRTSESMDVPGAEEYMKRRREKAKETGEDLTDEERLLYQAKRGRLYQKLNEQEDTLKATKVKARLTDLLKKKKPFEAR